MPLIESAIGGIAVSVFDKLWGAGIFTFGLFKKARDKKEAVKQIETAAEEYVNKYFNRHGQVKVMPGLMKEPLPLDDIYTVVKILDDDGRSCFATIENLERAYREFGKRSFQFWSKERHDGVNIANKRQYLMVLGGPGAGKSTFLRKLGLEALKKNGQIEKRCIPVFIELKSLKNEEIDLLKVIAQEFRICGFPQPEKFTEEALKDGKLLVLLDGLDEVPANNVNQVIGCIEDFVDRYDRNCFVASCRIAAYRSSFRSFTDVTLAEFDDEQIQQFINRWFHSEIDQQNATSKKYWKLLQKPEYQPVKELAQTPLLLTFLCLVYDREQTLPANRSTLYGDALNILMKEWAAQKRLERDPIYEGFHPELEKLLLAEVAYCSFKADQLFFSEENITEQIASFLADTLDAPKYLNGEAILKAIEVQQGILVQRATDAYSFSHLTLQEYLTAAYIVEHQLVNDVVDQHLFDERWREVILLISGLMRNRANQLLETIEQKIKKVIGNSQKLCSVLAWATANATNEEFLGKKAAARRAVASAIVIASDIANANAIDVASASAIAIAIDRAIDPGNNRVTNRDRAINQAIVSDRAAAKAIDRAVDRAISIAREIDSDIEIDNTLASIRVIVQAINRAVARARAITRATNNVIPKASHIAVDVASNVISDIANDITSDIDGVSSYIDQAARTDCLSIIHVDRLLIRLPQFQESIPATDAPTEAWKKWASDLQSAWLEVLGFDKDWMPFSQIDIETLNNYLYATELLILCKKSAIRISQSSWEKIEAKILTSDEILGQPAAETNLFNNS
jgi:phage terminase Nu1 subunit (DNA packaging protein)